MNRLASLTLSILLVLAAAPNASAEGADDLVGEWQVDIFTGEAPPENIEVKLSVMDEETMVWTVVVNGREDSVEELRYEATDDGGLIIYAGDNPAGDKAAWEIDEDGKLHIKSEGVAETVLSPVE